MTHSERKTPESHPPHRTQLIPADTRSGQPTLRVVTAMGERLLHSSYDPVLEAQKLVERFVFGGTGIVVVLGLGLGYHVAELSARFPGAEIMVIEALPEIEALAREHRGADFPAARLTCLSGLSSAAALQKITDRQVEAGMPPLAIFALPAAVAAFPDYYRELRQKLTASADLNLAGRLRYRKFSEERARVLLFDCGYFLTREVAAALRQLGHQVERLHFHKKTPVSQLLAGLVGKIATFRPDFCFTVNHLGFDEEGGVADFLRSIELPAASWFVDSPDLIVKGFFRNASPFATLFLWDSSYIGSMRKAGFENVYYLPLATDPGVFRPLPAVMPEVAGLTAKVGFVGNSMVVPLKDKLANVHPALHPLAERMAARLSRKRSSLAELLATLDDPEQRQVNRLKVRERLDFETAVTWHATLLYRRACIENLRSYQPVIHGDNGWETILDAGFTLRPSLDYYRELPSFYSSCTVNFNATNLQMGLAVNQRLFDVPACGGFLITDHQESLEELFSVGEDVITYREPEEIPDLVRFYLANPASRERVASLGRERVLRQHTYRHRITDIIAAMRKCYGI